MHITKCFRRFLGILFLLLPFAGCGANPDLGQVSGTVSYHGAPLAGASVTFTPERSDGVLAIGTTDEKGYYVLNSPISRGVSQGAISGKYRVTVSKFAVPPPSPDQVLYEEGKITYDELQAREAKSSSREPVRIPDLIPPRYSIADESGLTAEVVPKKKNVFDFVLTK